MAVRKFKITYVPHIIFILDSAELRRSITLPNNILFGISEYMTIANGSSGILKGYFSQFKITLKSQEKTATVERLQVLRRSTTFFPGK